MEYEDKQKRFEAIIMTHLDAAYNLARWMTRNEHDAEDVVQEALMRAFKFFGSLRSANHRSWFLAIVRNTTFSWLQKNRKGELLVDEEPIDIEDSGSTPDVALMQNIDQKLVREGLEQLAVEYREVTILRELEGMSYKEIAEITGIPIGTVMSRLARARQQLVKLLSEKVERRTLK